MLLTVCRRHFQVANKNAIGRRVPRIRAVHGDTFEGLWTVVVNREYAIAVDIDLELDLRVVM